MRAPGIGQRIDKPGGSVHVAQLPASGGIGDASAVRQQEAVALLHAHHIGFDFKPAFAASGQRQRSASRLGHE